MAGTNFFSNFSEGYRDTMYSNDRAEGAQLTHPWYVRLFQLPVTKRAATNAISKNPLLWMAWLLSLPSILIQGTAKAITEAPLAGLIQAAEGKGWRKIKIAAKVAHFIVRAVTSPVENMKDAINADNFLLATLTGAITGAAYSFIVFFAAPLMIAKATGMALHGGVQFAHNFSGSKAAFASVGKVAARLFATALPTALVSSFATFSLFARAIYMKIEKAFGKRDVRKSEQQRRRQQQQQQQQEQQQQQLQQQQQQPQQEQQQQQQRRQQQQQQQQQQQEQPPATPEPIDPMSAAKSIVKDDAPIIFSRNNSSTSRNTASSSPSTSTGSNYSLLPLFGSKVPTPEDDNGGLVVRSARSQSFSVGDGKKKETSKNNIKTTSLPSFFLSSGTDANTQDEKSDAPDELAKLNSDDSNSNNRAGERRASFS